MYSPQNTDKLMPSFAVQENFRVSLFLCEKFFKLELVLLLKYTTVGINSSTEVLCNLSELAKPLMNRQLPRILRSLHSWRQIHAFVEFHRNSQTLSIPRNLFEAFKMIIKWNNCYEMALMRRYTVLVAMRKVNICMYIYHLWIILIYLFQMVNHT